MADIKRSVNEILDPIVAEWVREGVVVPPSGTKLPLPASPVRVADGISRRLLDQGRDETRS